MVTIRNVSMPFLAATSNSIMAATRTLAFPWTRCTPADIVSTFDTPNTLVVLSIGEMRAILFFNSLEIIFVDTMAVGYASFSSLSSSILNPPLHIRQTMIFPLSGFCIGSAIRSASRSGAKYTFSGRILNDPQDESASSLPASIWPPPGMCCGKPGSWRFDATSTSDMLEPTSCSAKFGTLTSKSSLLS